MTSEVPAPYAAAWRSYRRRARTFFALALGFPLLLLGTTSVLPRLIGPEAGGELVLVLSLLWLTGTAIAFAARVLWPCPRCRRPFHLRGLRGASLTQRCLHCALGKWDSGVRVWDGTGRRRD